LCIKKKEKKRKKETHERMAEAPVCVLFCGFEFTSLQKCLKKMVYYMKRLDSRHNTIDTKIIQKLKEITDKLVHFGTFN
jgi:hypothetical protein